MHTKLNRRAFMLPIILAGLGRWTTPWAQAQDKPGSQPSRSATSQEVSTAAQSFLAAADKALLAMVRRAEELHIKGVAVVAYIEGERVASWSSKMVVVGSMKNAPTEKDKGANLLGIAYGKAAEMAESLKDSGTAGRPPMTGEFGWPGGVITKGKTGYLIAAFSGGPSEDDVRVSRAGLEVLASLL
jgi:uncharacterized protein GlcG (DUF336 family)